MHSLTLITSLVFLEYCNIKVFAMSRWSTNIHLSCELKKNGCSIYDKQCGLISLVFSLKWHSESVLHQPPSKFLVLHLNTLKISSVHLDTKENYLLHPRLMSSSKIYEMYCIGLLSSTWRSQVSYPQQWLPYIVWSIKLKICYISLSESDPHAHTV